VRAFRYGCDEYALVEGDAARRGDLLNERVSVIRTADRRVIPMSLDSFLPPELPIVANAAGVAIRELLEDALRAGFDDRWIAEVLLFAGRHGLFRCSRTVRAGLADPGRTSRGGAGCAPGKPLPEAVTGRGIELGAFHTPLRHGPDAVVTYVDAFDPATSRRFFPEVGREVPIVLPDVIAPADDLGRIAAGSQDFVAASHLLEHVADPIRAIREWRRVLRPGGWLYLRVPDRRGAFDRGRRPASVEHAIADFEDRAGAVERDREHYRDWARVVNKLEVAAQVDLWARLLMEARYPIHFHCWDRAEVERLFRHLATQGVAFEIVSAADYPAEEDFDLLLRRI
jgi:SAM-dependent methyltransferase